MYKTAFIPVASDFLTNNKVERIINANSARLSEIAKDRLETKNILKVEKVFYFIITGGTEQQILELQRKRDTRFKNEELVLLTHADNNSLAAGLELLACFQQDGKKGRIIYLPAPNVTPQYHSAIKSVQGNQRLKNSKIGLIGKPSDWLVASNPAADVIWKTWRAEVVPISLDKLKQGYSEIPEQQCDAIFSEFTGCSNEIIEPLRDDIIKNIKVYLVMKKLVGRYKLNAVTVRCFDLVLDLKTTGCFALSYLNDEGIIAGCEGDLVSTIGMLSAYKKTGKLPWMANPSRLNIKNNSVVLAHCTVPRSIAEDYTIRSHFESGIGVGIQGKIAFKKVTIFRLGGKNLSKIWLASGVIISNPEDENLCRTQIEVKLDAKYSVAELLENPLGNHLIIVPGKLEGF